MQSCPFCQADIADRTLAHTNLVRVIFSDPRLVKGHLLVIPKRHVEAPWELTPAEQTDICTQLFMLQQRLASTFGTGCDIRQNYRPFLPQGRVKVDHVHFHLLPRTLNDELYQKSLKFETAMFTALPDTEVAEVTKALGL